MQKTAAAFVGLACCILCLSEQSIAYLASPRAMLVYVLALWLRCEWCVQNRGSEETESRNKTVKENYELSQTVVNLSDQHKLLCDIRNTALKLLRYSKDTFAELRFPSAMKRSYTSSSSSQSPCVSTPESKPDSSAETRQVSPLGRPVDPVLRSRAAFRRGSMSETNVSMHGGKRTEEP